ncbi:hypothetical protein [Bacillus massilioanorexius]|nr:hypothetical protein [Bacillus massilioanorexius]
MKDTVGLMNNRTNPYNNHTSMTKELTQNGDSIEISSNKWWKNNIINECLEIKKRLKDDKISFLSRFFINILRYC